MPYQPMDERRYMPNEHRPSRTSRAMELHSKRRADKRRQSKEEPPIAGLLAGFLLLLQDFVELGGAALGGDKNDRPNRQKTKDKNGGERQQRPNALCQPSVDKIGGKIGGV